MTKRRILGWTVVLLFIFGGAAACSDDDGDDGGDSTEEDSGDSGGDSGGGESGNAEVEDYCAAAEELAAEIDDFDITDPSSGDVTELTDQATELTNQAADLSGSGLDQADGERLTECSQIVTDAAANLAG